MDNRNNIIINVGRQIGSGGHIVAKMLAEDFNCRLYDRELLNLAAQESGFSEEFFEQNDERKGFLKSLFHVHTPYVSDTSFYNNDFSQEGLFKFQSDAIRKAAAEGSCVFVGRCADYVLRDFPRVVNIFITADLDQRIQAVSEREHCSAEDARKKIEEGESGRSSYYNYYTGKRWGSSESYDLCVNSSRLGLEGTACFVHDFICRTLGIDR